MPASVLVFDLETVPDVAGLRKLGDIPDGVSDSEVAEAAFEKRREKTGSDFLPLHLHRIVAIGCLFRNGDTLQVKCLGSPDDVDEARLIRGFFGTIDRHTPQLVSWNGGGFDLQVLHYRALIHGITATRYWEQGDDDRDFRFNNYLSRYHSRHLDLMDLLALYNGRANAPLDDLAKLCGFPGKLGVDGSKVWEMFQQGGLAEIRDYCETDVANTWLMYCRFQRMRGAWNDERYRDEIALTRATLSGLDGKHWSEFLDAWKDDAAG